MHKQSHYPVFYATTMLLLLFLVVFSVASSFAFTRDFSKSISNQPQYLTFNQHFPLPSLNHTNILSSKDVQQYLCTEATVSFNVDFYGGKYANLTASADLRLYTENGNDYLEVSNATGLDSTFNRNLSHICYYNVDDLKCNMHLTNPYSFYLDKGDPYVDILGYYGEMPKYGTQIYYGYANNGTISNMDGTLFSPNNTCNNYFINDPNNQTINQTTCCTMLIPAPSIPSTSNATRCKRFRSRTILYNNDYSTHATSAINYTLTNNNQIITVGDFIAPNDTSFVTYYFTSDRQCDSRNSSTLNCTVNLPKYDSKTIIKMSFSNSSDTVDVPVVGIFLIRNNQTLIYEGIPFSSKNDCAYNTYKGPLGMPTSAEFCCKEFK